jgi:hypothetical protein
VHLFSEPTVDLENINTAKEKSVPMTGGRAQELAPLLKSAARCCECSVHIGAEIRITTGAGMERGVKVPVAGVVSINGSTLVVSKE